MRRLCPFCESSSLRPRVATPRATGSPQVGLGTVARSRSRRGTRRRRSRVVPAARSPVPDGPRQDAGAVRHGSAATWPIPAGAPTSGFAAAPVDRRLVPGSGARSGGACSLERQAHRDRRGGGHRSGFGRSGRRSGGNAERHRRPERHVRPRRSGRFQQGGQRGGGAPPPGMSGQSQQGMPGQQGQGGQQGQRTRASKASRTSRAGPTAYRGSRPWALPEWWPSTFARVRPVSRRRAGTPWCAP